MSDKTDLAARPPPDVLEELAREFSRQDVRLFKMSLGRPVDPSNSVRLSEDGDGGLIAVGRSPEAVAAVLEKVHAAGRAGKPIECEFEVVPWQGERVRALLAEIFGHAEKFSALAAQALPPPQPSKSSTSEGGKE